MKKSIFSVLFINLLLLLLACGSSRPEIGFSDNREASNEELARLESQAKSDSINWKSHFILGKAYLSQKIYDLAENSFNTARTLNTLAPEINIELALICLATDRQKEGYSALLKVIQTPGGENYINEIARRLGNPYQSEQITHGNYHNAVPSFSLDGKMIVFQTDRHENMEIYSLEIASNYERRLTNHPARDEFPLFSPSGKFLAFTSTRNDTTHQYEAEKMRDIFFCDPEGNEVQQFTDNLDDDWHPAFHPDGEMMAFVSSRDDVRGSTFSEQWSNLYLLNLKTRNLKPLTSDNVQVGCPCFSPDGKSLVMNNNSTGKFHLYRMNLKNRQLEQLTFHVGNDAAPRFNPKGNKVVFFSDKNGNFDLFLLDLTNSNLQQLTTLSSDECYPDFSPDGKKIVYQAMVDGKFQIFWLDLTQPLLKDSLIKIIETKMAELGRETKRKPK